MKNFLLFSALIFSFQLFSQYSVSAGSSTIKAFGVQGVYPGFHVGIELTKDEESSLYGRIGIYPGKKGDKTNGVAFAQGKTFDAIPYSYDLSTTEKYNYTVVEFGKRFYFGNGFDNGFGFYGGTNLNLVFNKVKFDIENYDVSKYDLYIGNDVITDRAKAFGSIFGVAFGLNAGLKHSFYFGTIYLDGGLSYPLLAQPSNNIATYTTMYQPLIFNINLGFRKDFY